MLPQMMPLPWIFVFFLIFYIFYSVLIYLNFFFPSNFLVEKKVLKVSTFKMPW